jgi:hypothetical protein
MRCATRKTPFLCHPTPFSSRIAFVWLKSRVFTMHVCEHLQWGICWKKSRPTRNLIWETRDKGHNAESGTTERIHTADGNVLVLVDETRGRIFQGFLCRTLNCKPLMATLWFWLMRCAIVREVGLCQILTVCHAQN